VTRSIARSVSGRAGPSVTVRQPLIIVHVEWQCQGAVGGDVRSRGPVSHVVGPAGNSPRPAWPAGGAGGRPRLLACGGVERSWRVWI